MILTEIDLKILRIFWKLNREELKSPWKIMKKIYPNGGNDENQKIMYHLKKMNNYGLVTVNNTKISNDLTLRIYNLDSKKVKLKKYKFDTLKKSFNTNGNVKQLMATLNGWLNEYKDAGEKLPLKQTVGYLIKLYELRVKIDQIEKESNQSNNQNMVKEFITKIQDEFSSNPKVTKEVEIKYNKEGVITSKKAKLTTNLDGEEDIITEEEELEMEDAELEKEQLKIEVRK